MADDIFTRLAEPFDPSLVSWRVGQISKKDGTKARALAYLDARDVMKRLDEVMGPPHWQARYIPMPNGTTCCEIGIEIGTDRWVWKANGAGNTDIEAEKGAYSDAFKRAAVLWGIGQYLYDIDSPWVTINQWKQIEENELSKLRRLLPNAKSAYAARKDGDFERITGLLRACVNVQDLQTAWKAEQKLIASWPDSWQEHITEEKDRIKSGLMAGAAA